MSVAWHAQVVSAAHVGAELEGVIAQEFRRIADELELILVLIKWAVATVNTETGAELEAIIIVSTRIFDKPGEKTGGEIIEVQPWYTYIGRRCLTEVEGQYIDLVTEKSEAEIGYHSRRPRIIKPKCDTVVFNLGSAAE